MVWTAKQKKINTRGLTGHRPPAKPNVQGRAPEVLTISFTPQELFGAMARCSQLNVIDPALVTPESETCKALLARHVDDTAEAFFLEQSVKKLKDHFRTNLVGTVGSGIAYLQMIQDGYVWCDHFENLQLASDVDCEKQPDLVFNRPGCSDVALTEAKGTHGSSRGSFQSRVKSGYEQQLEPYLGAIVGGAAASHGMCIGSWMASPTAAELIIHHTEAPSGKKSPDISGSPSAVRKGNYITVLGLMFGASVSSAARSGLWPGDKVTLPTVRWLDRLWVRGTTIPSELTENNHSGFAFNLSGFGGYRDFALEANVAKAVLASLSAWPPFGPLDDISVMPAELIARAQLDGGALYPDGFAVLGRSREEEGTEPLTLSPLREGALATMAVREQLQQGLAQWLDNDHFRSATPETLRLTIKNGEG